MGSSTFTSRVDYEAELEVKKRIGLEDPRPQILSMDGFNAKDAAEADPAAYRLIDIVKTLVYLEAGVDGVIKIFGKKDPKVDSRPCRLRYFDPETVADCASFQKKNFWEVTTQYVEPEHDLWIQFVEVKIWAQVDMKREVDLDCDIENWDLRDLEARPMARMAFTVDEDLVCTPKLCTLLPSTLNYAQPAQIEAVSRTMIMMLLAKIAVLKEGRRVRAGVSHEPQKTVRSPNEADAKISKVIPPKRTPQNLKQLRAILSQGSSEL